MNIYKKLILSFVSFSLICCSKFKLLDTIEPDDPNIQYVGRIDYSDPKSVQFSYPGVMIKAKFEGRTCNLLLKNLSDQHVYKNYYNLLIDDQPPFVIGISNFDKKYELELPNDGEHTITIFKRTESFVGKGIFEGFELERGKKLLPLNDVPKRKIEFIGNSVTCGFGNEGDSATCHFTPETENNYMAYGAITARSLQAEYMAVAYSGKGISQNYDQSDKETMPDIYDRIFPEQASPVWDFKRWIPDVVVINLGTNDFAHRVDSALFVSNYVHFLEKVKANYPKASIFCIEGCMTTDDWPEGMKSLTTVKNYINVAMQSLYSKGEQNIYTFFPTTMQEGEIGCDWHPKVIRHQKMADELTTFIKEKTGW